MVVFACVSMKSWVACGFPLNFGTKSTSMYTVRVMKNTHTVDVVLGLQWGDEGKGKIVDALARDYDLVARFQGGPNAGHTLEFDGKHIVLHTIPSGVFVGATNLIGANVVLDPISFVEELAQVEPLVKNIREVLLIAREVNIIIPTHKILDKAAEVAKGEAKIGTTLRGIGPAYMDKTGRNGLRIGYISAPDFATRYEMLKTKHLKLLEAQGFLVDAELLSKNEKEFFEAIEVIKTFTLANCSTYMNTAIDAGKKILGEGAQGSMLDIDHGFVYPFVTSSSTTSAGMCTGLGIAPQKIGRVIGITKAYCTRVGSGPFPTKLTDEWGEKLRQIGHEFGATTGRPRDCGWIDLPVLKKAILLSGVTEIAITKLDILDTFEEIKVCTAYSIDGVETTELPFDPNLSVMTPVYKTFPGWQTSIKAATSYEALPENLKTFVSYLETELGVRATYLSTGPEREATIIRNRTEVA